MRCALEKSKISKLRQGEPNSLVVYASMVTYQYSIIVVNYISRRIDFVHYIFRDTGNTSFDFNDYKQIIDFNNCFFQAK